MFRYRSFAFVYSGADRENLTALPRPRLLTRIDLLHSYRTGPESDILREIDFAAIIKDFAVAIEKGVWPLDCVGRYNHGGI